MQRIKPLGDLRAHAIVIEPSDRISGQSRRDERLRVDAVQRAQKAA